MACRPAVGDYMRGPYAYPGITADVVIEISFIICTHEKRVIPPPMETDSRSMNVPVA